jgi:hypothetical protein
MTSAPPLIIEFPAAGVTDSAATKTVVAAARDTAAIAAARSVPLLLPETADGGPGLDPSILAGILAADLLGPNTAGTVTRPAGAAPRLIVTAATSRNAPYNLARRIQSLNRITCGQVGLFLRADGLDPVTSGASSQGAAATGQSRLLSEYVEVLRRLWVSFPEEALIGDREAGRFADPRSLVPASFTGEVYSVGGALNVPLPSAHRTLLLTDAVGTAPGGAVDGVIAPDSNTPDSNIPGSTQGSGAVPAYRTVTWLPSNRLPAEGTRGIEVAGTPDDAARVLLDGPPGHVLLRVRAGASEQAALLDALFDVLPDQHESRDLQAHAG